MTHKITKLDNGITLIMEKMMEVESVSIKIVVSTGARYENDKTSGISHFLEHMAFKGTETRTAKQIAFDFGNIGASFNAYTAKESTAFYCKVLKEYWQNAFEILTDLFLNSTFDKTELEKERGVILQELAMTNDTPDEIIFDYFMETVFQNQQLGKTILGPKQNIKRFKKNDFIDYITKQYTADNIYIGVCGNIDFNSVEKFVRDNFLIVKKTTENKAEKGKYIGGYFNKVKKNLEQVQCVLGFDGLSYVNKNYFKSIIGNIIFGSGASSRLFQEIRENNGLCYTISSGNSAYNDCGVFSIYIGTDPKKLTKAVEKIVEECKKFIDKDVSDDELNRAKVKVKSSMIMGLESVSSRNSGNIGDYRKYGKIYSVKELTEIVESTTKKDIRNIFTNFFSSTPTLAIYGNGKGVYDYEKFKQLMK